MKLKLTAVFEQVPEGYIGYVEELPGANTQAGYPRRSPRQPAGGGRTRPRRPSRVGRRTARQPPGHSRASPHHGVKRTEPVRHLEAQGCRLLREGAKHSVYVNRATGKATSVSRRHAGAQLTLVDLPGTAAVLNVGADLWPSQSVHAHSFERVCSTGAVRATNERLGRKAPTTTSTIWIGGLACGSRMTTPQEGDEATLQAVRPTSTCRISPFGYTGFKGSTPVTRGHGTLPRG